MKKIRVKLIIKYFILKETAEKLKIGRGTYLDYMKREGKLPRVVDYSKIDRSQNKYKKSPYNFYIGGIGVWMLVCMFLV